MTFTSLALIISGVFAILFSKWRIDKLKQSESPKTAPDEAQTPDPVVIPEPVITPKIEPNMPDPLTTLLPWTTQKNYFHNVRVLCDRAGLTYNQKEIVCACIWIESRFRDYYSDGTPVTNGNKDKTGKVWSTDWGLVQCNDYFNIGKGKPFPSVDYVLKNPQATASWMINTIKTTGRLQPWASYTSGVYKQALLPSSGMQALRTN